MHPLATAALVGTARQPNPSLQTVPSLDVMVTALPPAPPERLLLLAAGAWSVYRQAARMAGPPAAKPVPSPPETQPVLPARLAAMLGDLFAGRCPTSMMREGTGFLVSNPGANQYQELLPEALGLVARAGWRLPAELLPEALKAQSAELRQALLPVLGTRGCWLAGFNPAWRWATAAGINADLDLPGAAETIWQEGSPFQRKAILKRLRETNPTQAREWLAEAWKAEKADIRHELLEALETTLAPADEPFLEAALDDKSDRVRARSAALLARIPDSALSARMLARAEAMMSYTAGSKPAQRLTVTPPESIDKTWQRDGFLAKPAAGAPGGHRGRWLVQALSLISPTHWSNRFGVPPSAILEAAAHSDWVQELYEGWSHAALVHREQAWLGPLWECWRDVCTGAGRILEPLCREMLSSLLAALPPAEAERRLGQILITMPNPPQDPWATVLSHLPRPWSAEFSMTCLQQLRQVRPWFSDGRPYSNFWFHSLSTMAQGISPASLPQALSLSANILAGDESPTASGTARGNIAYWQPYLDTFAESLRIRLRLHREIAP